MFTLDLLLIRPSNWPLYPKGERKTFLEPLGLEYIAGECIRRGFTVKILDMDRMNNETADLDLASILETDRPRYIGLSVFSPLVDECSRVILFIRERINSRIFVGGPHVSALISDREYSILDDINADFYIGGEGEYKIADILEKRDWGKKIYSGNQRN